MAQIFSQGDGAKAFEEFLYSKYEGNPQDLDQVENWAYKFTWARALKTLNVAEQAVGSWGKGHAAVLGDNVYFSVKNTMGSNSLLFGRQLGEYGITPVGEIDSDLHMTIEWISPRRN